MRVELQAMDEAKGCFERKGYSVEDVSHSRAHKGYDLVVGRAGETVRVEVKGCTRPWQIPDPYETEFDCDRKLVADILCVVYLMDPLNPDICLIPRDAIPPEMVKPKSGYRISGRFKKQHVLEQYRVCVRDLVDKLG